MSEVEKAEALIARLTKPTRQLHRHTRKLISKSSPAIQHEAADAIRALLDELSRLREVLVMIRDERGVCVTCGELADMPSNCVGCNELRPCRWGPQDPQQIAARALSDRSQEGRDG